jgi:hypothetical protein
MFDSTTPLKITQKRGLHSSYDFRKFFKVS